MPTIDELAAAASVSDTDELVVSQSDVARKATRGQLLSGVQPALAVPQGALLGRVSAGTGSPEAVAIGANLTLANATLSAPAAFVVAEQTIGGPPNAGDLIALAQGGQNAAISYASFAAGLAGIQGIDASAFISSVAGGAGTRDLSSIFSDSISVESFGAVGDGETDDTAAFTMALASGRTLRLDSRVYAIAGTLSILQPIAIIGVAGGTVLRRASPGSGGVWIDLKADMFVADGVTFDAASLAATDAPAFAIDSNCNSAMFHGCAFVNAMGSVSGDGLLVNGNSTTSVLLADCQFTANIGSGVAVQNAGSVIVRGCSATGNGANGISVASGIFCIAEQNCCTGNQVGISIGNWQAAAPIGQAAIACRLSNNSCSINSYWGIAASGNDLTLNENICTSNGSSGESGGIVCRAVNGRITGNRVVGGAAGVDARTCVSTLIAANHVEDATIGILAGSAQNIVVSQNFLLQNAWGISVSAFEPSLSFIPTGPISIDRNWIGFTVAQAGGIRILDAVQGASITDNELYGWGSALASQSLWLHTDAAVVRGNRWNNTAQFLVAASLVGGKSSLVVPDAADSILVTSAPPGVDSVLTAHQVDTLGQITFLRILQAGAGYTTAQVAIGGSGSGAAATAVCDNGQVIGFTVTNPGSGYGAIGASAPVTISGDGAGATATAYVGLPVMAGRSLRISCNAQLRLTVGGSSPAMQSWTQYDLTVPAFGAVDLVGAFGGWYAVQSPPIDYLAPTGNGGMVLQSVSGGDVYLRPSAGGELHIASGSEPLGCTTTVGRGSPSGAVAAPPGSDFRNLDGGAGNTFWIKCTGNDTAGWIAVA